MRKGNSTYALRTWWGKMIVALCISFILILSIAQIYPTKQVKTQASMDEFTSHLDNRIPVIMNDYNIPGANILMVKSGKIVWNKAYGFANIDKKIKMSNENYFRVQSISKSVTAWGIMKLADQGKIELDTPIEQYIKSWEFPESQFSEEKITVRHLLTHTAGLYIGDFLTRYSPTGNIPDLKENLLNEAIMKNEPGRSFSYSNVGYNMLELLIEEVSGREYSEYMEQEIMIPLGMHHSNFELKEEFSSKIPTGYNLVGDAIPIYVYSHKASGGLFATAEDIANFLIAEIALSTDTEKVLSTQYVNEITKLQVYDLGFYNIVFDGYGFGHYIEILTDGKKMISHGGQGTGWMTHFHASPETGDGIVILTNSQRSWPFIAYILSDWSKWSGLSSLGMERIIIGIKLLWFFIFIVWSVVFYQLWRITEGLALKERRFAKLSKRNLSSRVLPFILSIAIAIVLLWCVSQDYLFISSVFPIVSKWLCISMSFLSIILLLMALAPKQKIINNRFK